MTTVVAAGRVRVHPAGLLGLLGGGAAGGRPLAAFCACELRSPARFTEDGFRAFNEVYAGTLKRWGVMTGDANPVARSNVCPAIDPPAEPSFHAFCFTVAAQSAMAT